MPSTLQSAVELPALASLSVYRLPADYFDTYRTRIAAVTPDDVLNVARAHLHPEALHIVAVGAPDVMRPQLSSLGDVNALSVAEVEVAI